MCELILVINFTGSYLITWAQLRTGVCPLELLLWNRQTIDVSSACSIIQPLKHRLKWNAHERCRFWHSIRCHCKTLTETPIVSSFLNPRQCSFYLHLDQS